MNFQIGDLVKIRQKYEKDLADCGYDDVVDTVGVVIDIKVTGTDPDTGHKFGSIHAQFINGRKTVFYDFVYEHAKE